MSEEQKAEKMLEGEVGGMACHKCGCRYFVWWIEDQGVYSSKTAMEFYDRDRHLRAVCLECNATFDGVGAAAGDRVCDTCNGTGWYGDNGVRKRTKEQAK